MNDPFEASSRYYDLLYRDKNTSAEVAYVEALLQRHRIAGRDLLEFGSGTGRHGCLLAQRGYRVHGLERSAAMVANAQRTPGFSCQQCDINSTQLERRFNAVLALFHVVSYQTSNPDVQAVFANAARHLHPGGLFLFDVWYSPAVAAQRPELRVKRLQSEDLSIIRIAEPTVHPNENRVDVHYTVMAQELSTGTIQTFEETHPMRHFSLPELDLLAESAGFERLTAEEWLSGAPPSQATWGICLVLQRR
ncbi:class I SAM-dependent methyltransferase [Cyanobium sp. CH-040]|uniref:class I SAM-dependent DNA methyltransferase n=1 Tax=Cyanobium sp. CH-040 TaxID=2823708 RepID=UPI0020CCB742|nr:class I SAM-dependent methyltransferase [Cyanobium sp. CH-040]MCP9926736.1 methyltransferase domain-containing protein [Cyanobium sp. CH-040]